MDIGCGNGFFDYFFFSDIASSIDAIDTNEDALKIAKKKYSSKNIFYYKLDVTKDSFPRDRYNVIIMDSSIMYLKENETEILMSKITSCMDDDSLFVGSATMQPLENTEKDNLQKFYSSSDMEKFLLKYFNKVHVWSNDEVVYKQVYFRCARTDKAVEKILKN
ncbi:MAG: class I SAM-dependent methyltransferase [Thaumarchaeota archaeon]|nr:class I SAM-dependent methyltransferase [Nitrososphaerota archaeon]